MTVDCFTPVNKQQQSFC